MGWTTGYLLASLVLANGLVSGRVVKVRKHSSDLAPVGLEKRATVNWANLGCYSDASTRTLNGGNTVSSSVTVEWCQANCLAQGYLYAGVEYTNQCFCGNSIAAGSSIASSNCNMPCAANSAEKCGGSWAMNLYYATGVQTSTSSGKYTYTNMGCYTDSNTRVLQGSFTSNGQVTNDYCANLCGAAGYSYAGTEAANQCFCGNTVIGSSPGSSACNQACAGDSSKICGGSWGLSLFSIAPTTPTTRSGTYPGGTYSGGTCYLDQSSRILSGPLSQTAAQAGTPALCAAWCAGQGYSMMGVEAGYQCFCGNSLNYNTGANNCNNVCSGDSSQMCGGSWAINVFNIKATATSTSTTSTSTTSTSTTSPASTPTSWTFAGGTYTGGSCLTDSSNRILSVYKEGSFTPATCVAYCAGLQYKYAGVEYTDECWCGNTVNGNAPSTACNMPCSGDNTQICGGSWGLNLYTIQLSTSTSTTSTTPATTPASTTPTTSTTTTSTTSAPAASQTWTFAGGTYSGGNCLADAAGARLFTVYTVTAPITPATCVPYCSNLGYIYAGVENASECWCGNSLVVNNPSTGCTMPCTADKTQICGGAYAINLYTIQRTTSTTTSTTPTPSPTTGIISSNAAAALVTTQSAPASAPTRSLFAHYMVGNTQNYNQGMWQGEMSQAKSAGFDAFALNMGADGYEPQQITYAFQAAQSIGFKAFLSLDVTSLSCQNTGDAQNLANLVLNAYKGFPSTYVTYTPPGGTATILVSVFSGNWCSLNGGTAKQFWAQVRANIAAGGYAATFAPSMFIDPSNFATGGSNDWADIPFNWNSGWPMGATPLDTSSDLAWISGSGNKPYMAAISPCFFTYYGPNSWNKDWIYRSDDWLLASRFEMLIGMRNQVQYAELVSWNDYGESHYIGTIGPNQPNSQGWTNGMPHTAWLSLINYYSTAWKTGAYPAPFDGLWLWSRPHPKGVTATSPSNPKPSNWQYTDDNLYVIALLASPATVKIYSGTNFATAVLQAGMNKLSLASAAGAIGATISRSGAVVKSYDSTGSFSYNLTPADYNFNYFVASA